METSQNTPTFSFADGAESFVHCWPAVNLAVALDGSLDGLGLEEVLVRDALGRWLCCDGAGLSTRVLVGLASDVNLIVDGALEGSVLRLSSDILPREAGLVLARRADVADNEVLR